MQEILDNLKAFHKAGMDEYEDTKDVALALGEHKALQDVWELFDKTFCAAENAVEKQIAKDPAEKTINNVKYPICPECGRVLWGKELYCATCGQRVNRGE